jgi:hypothetical protein
MKRDYSFTITKKQYDYLLPVFGISSGNNRLLAKEKGYYFIGTNDDYLDMLNRCKYIN